MKVILIQGREDTGKTTFCKAIDEWLQSKVFNRYRKNLNEMIAYKTSFPNYDFFAVYEIQSKKSNKPFKIIINTLCDVDKYICEFEKFYHQYKIYKLTEFERIIINSSCSSNVKNVVEDLLQKEQDRYNKSEKLAEEIKEDINSSTIINQNDKDILLKDFEDYYDLFITAIRSPNSKRNKKLAKRIENLYKTNNVKIVNLDNSPFIDIKNFIIRGNI